MRERLTKKLFRLSSRQDGATAIEFALIFPLFLLFFLGVIEIGLIMFGNSVINNVMNQAVQRAMVGCERFEYVNGVCQQAFTIDPAKLKQDIRRKSAGLVNSCDPTKFTISSRPIAATEDDAGNLVMDMTNPGTNTMDLGQGDQVVVYYASYNWPTFVPFLKLQQVFGLYTRFEYSTIVRNERFGNMGAVRVLANGGC